MKCFDVFQGISFCNLPSSCNTICITNTTLTGSLLTMERTSYMRLALAPQRTSFSFLRELDPMFRDHEAMAMYRDYLLRQTNQPSLAYHIDFFEEMSELEAVVEEEEEEEERMAEIYHKYFHEDGECLLEVKKEIIEKIRGDVERAREVSFEPAIKMVVRDLAFAHFNG